jgi:Tol biopolymer transport system component
MRKRPIFVKILRATIILFIASALNLGCLGGMQIAQTVPHEGRWGIYALDLETQFVELLYSTDFEISTLRLNNRGDVLLFGQKIGGQENEHSEICTILINGENFTQLTNNDLWDLYPVWSPDGSQIGFLSFRQTDLDIYVMNANGDDQHLLYDSGSHDADIDWQGDKIIFTANSRIWMMNSDGTQPVQVTDPPRAGEWGQANLPFGDYDPRLNPDANRIVFERLEDDASPHGNYNLYFVNTDGSGETRLTDTGYAQGLASWSHSGDKLVYIVSAIGEAGQFDIYMMSADGSENRNITPGYFPSLFLIHEAIFSVDDSRIFFIGEWWE